MLPFAWIIFSRLNTIKEFPTSFPSLILHAVNFALNENTLMHSFQNYYCKHTKYPPTTCLYGRDQDVSLMEAIVGGWLPLQAKDFELPPSVGYTPHSHPYLHKNWFLSSLPWSQATYWERNICNSFWTSFTKFFVCGMHFQLHNHNLFEKLLGTKSLNTKQCPVGLSPKNCTLYIPLFYKKCPSFDVALLHPPYMDYPPSL